MLNRNDAAVDLKSFSLKSLTDVSVNEQQGKTEKPYWYDGVHSHRLVPQSNPTQSLTFYCMDEENERKHDRVCELKHTGVQTLLWGEPPH